MLNAEEVATQPVSRSALVLPARGSLRYSLLMAFACVAGVRLFLTLYLAGAALLFPQPGLRQQYAGTGVRLLDTGWEGALLGVWQREDALWYEKIATVGYSVHDMTTQSFPLLPVLMRLLSLATGMHPVAAGIVVSEVSLLLALFLLHRLLLPDFGPDVANRSLVYLSLFPTAFFLHGPFTESLMLALVMGSFFLVSRGHWGWAAATAYLAGLTRPQGVVLGVALAVDYLLAGDTFRHWRAFRRGAGPALRSLVLLVAPLLGFGTFLLLVDTPWRRPGVPTTIGPAAFQSLVPPFVTLVYSVRQLLEGVVYPIEVFNLVTAVVFLALLAGSFPRLGAGYAVAGVLFYMLPLSRLLPGFPLMSFSRYALLVFPCFVVLAIWGQRKWVHLTVIFLWLWWLVVWSFEFYTGYFVG